MPSIKRPLVENKVYEKRSLTHLFRKNVEQRAPPIILNPYKQIASSFIMGNRDRFGQNYFPMKQQSLVPGPGTYEAPTDFRSHMIPQLYSRNNLINTGKYSSLSKVNTISNRR
jgi:hypothetical protein